MPLPDILALDFDGVLCDGMPEYFETSRRVCARVWPDEPSPSDDFYPQFRELRPVILSGWEMPLLLRAIGRGEDLRAMLERWEDVRDRLVRADPAGATLVGTLTRTVDDVRREWMAADLDGWIRLNVPYCGLDELQRLVAEPECAVLVTTKEGGFARRILERWGVALADIQGKEAGVHKCENLRTMISRYTARHARRPRVWFVEDRIETLRHVTMHDDLDDVRLFLAAWGYNTVETRASARGDARLRLLELDQFRRGLAAWLERR